jgi:hypothetical protein
MIISIFRSIGIDDCWNIIDQLIENDVPDCAATFVRYPRRQSRWTVWESYIITCSCSLAVTRGLSNGAGLSCCRIYRTSNAPRVLHLSPAQMAWRQMKPQKSARSRTFPATLQLAGQTAKQQVLAYSRLALG